MYNYLLLSGLSAISWAISVILDKQYLNSFVEEFLELINNK